MNEVPPGRPARHDLHGAQQRRGLPVALGAEAVAVRHEPLHREAGELLEAVEVLEGGGEALEAAVLEERAQPQLDAARRRAARRGAPRRGAARGATS
jgi:hypothetical protein